MTQSSHGGGQKHDKNKYEAVNTQLRDAPGPQNQQRCQEIYGTQNTLITHAEMAGSDFYAGHWEDQPGFERRIGNDINAQYAIEQLHVAAFKPNAYSCS
jgi:hypothetical protein